MKLWGGDHVGHPGTPAPMAVRAGESHIASRQDKRDAVALIEAVGRLARGEAVKWLAPQGAIDSTRALVEKLKGDSRPSYNRTGLRAELALAKLAREYLTEARLAAEAVGGGVIMPTEGVTISQATKLIQETVVRQTAVAPPSVDHST